MKYADASSRRIPFLGMPSKNFGYLPKLRVRFCRRFGSAQVRGLQSVTNFGPVRGQAVGGMKRRIVMIHVSCNLTDKCATQKCSVVVISFLSPRYREGMVALFHTFDIS